MILNTSQNPQTAKLERVHSEGCFFHGSQSAPEKLRTDVKKAVHARWRENLTQLQFFPGKMDPDSKNC